MEIVVMVSVVAVIGSALVAIGTYFVDRSADRRDHIQDH
jgi:hypothetical protein